MTTAAAWQQSQKQRLAALRHANEIRTARAQRKRQLREDGPLVAALLLLSPPEELLRMKTTEFLGALPKFGPHRVKRTLVACRISDAKTVGGLSARQRGELVALLSKTTASHGSPVVGAPCEAEGD